MRHFTDMEEMIAAVPVDASGWRVAAIADVQEARITSVSPGDEPGTLTVRVLVSEEWPRAFVLIDDDAAELRPAVRLGVVTMRCYGSPTGEQITADLTFFAILED